MRILINDREYTITGEDQKKLVETLFKEAEKYYSQMPPTFQVIIDQLSRGLLYSAEKKMIDKGISPEIAKEIRPAKKQSPSLKFLEVLASNVDEPASKLTLSMAETDFELYNFKYWFDDGPKI